jgi:hypothetical protein
MNVDFIGVENVSKAIELSKLTKFTIYRASEKGHYTPIFECIDSDSNENAVEQFNELAKLLNPYIQYKITLFDFAETSLDANGQPVVKKGNNKTQKRHYFTFTLNTAPSLQPSQQPTNPNIGLDVASLRADILKELSKSQEENAILKEIAELKKKFAELDEEDEEDEEDNNSLAGIDKNQIAQILGLINMFKPNQQPPTINGTDDKTPDVFKSNINKAIKTLYKYDKQLDTDLLKLSEIAESKPDTFNMLLSTLRTM